MNDSAGTLLLPEGCIAVLSTGQNWNNSKDGILNAAILLGNVKVTIFIPVLFLIGVPSNCLNMVVFAKHGLDQRYNVSLFSLSLVNLVYVILIFCRCTECLGPLSLYTPRPIGDAEALFVNYRLLGLSGLVWSSLYIYALIAVDCCFCVVLPLRFKEVLKARTMAIIIASGVVVITGGRFAVTEKYRAVCVFDVVSQRSFYALFVSDYYLQFRQMVDSLDTLVYGLLLPVSALVTVTITTTVTAISLRKAVAWRKASANALPSKEIAVTKMLIYLSMQFIVFNLPNILFRVTCALVPDISIAGVYYGLYFFLLNLVEMIALMSSCLHFLIYVLSGTKYRKTLACIFLRRSVSNNRSTTNASMM